MLVQVHSFGTNWWARFGHDPADPHRFTRRAAYYNSTGIRCGSKVRRHWMVPGLIRFNGVGDFNPHRPESSIGKTFECSDLTFAFGGNRLLFERRVRPSALPDCYLVVITSAQQGPIDMSSDSWRSASTRVIAVSRLRLIQETMLLMSQGDWIETGWGFWQLQYLAPHGTPRLDFSAKTVLGDGN
jgi:hypothetical protein